MSKKQIQTMHDLLKKLPSDPEPEQIDTVFLLGELCEDLGFSSAAAGLKRHPETGADPRGFPMLQALAGLRLLFGDGKDAKIEHAFEGYSACCGLDEQVRVAPCETTRFSISPQIMVRFRKLVLVLDEEGLPGVVVRDIGFGILSAFASYGFVPFEMFGLLAPEFFRKTLYPGQSIFVEVENLRNQSVLIMGCALGDEIAFDSASIPDPLSGFKMPRT